MQPPLQQLLQLAEQARNSGDLTEATRIVRLLVSKEPNEPRWRAALAQVCWSAGQRDEAVDAFREAVRLAPDSIEAHNELGNLLQANGKFPEAIAIFEQAQQLQPERAEIAYNLANACRAAGDLARAETCYRHALRLSPRLVAALNNLGTLCQARGDMAEAEHCFRAAIRHEPGHPEAHYNLGVVHHKQERLDEALASYQQVIALRPDYAQAHYNLGTLYQHRRQWSEARASFLAAMRAAPDFAEPYCHLAVICLARGEYEEARTLLDKSLALQPELAESHYNLGMWLLVHGDFAAGWREFDWHARCATFVARHYDAPQWDGAPLAGRTVLIHCDHGLGDTLQFVRYLEAVRARGAGRIILAAQRVLGPLLCASGYNDFVPCDEPLPPFDLHATMLSLPGIFRAGVEAIPAQVPYLGSTPERIEHWRGRLKDMTGLRVGIAWQGNLKFAWDEWRSMPLAEFEPLAKVDGVRLISLQKGDDRDATRASAERLGVIDLGEELDRDAGAFMDTAAVIGQLDLVVTSDTATAHLAGALGAPVWVALPRAPEWRWMLERPDTPWYPTMRLFRQQSLGDWRAPFRQMAAELTVLARERDD